MNKINEPNSNSLSKQISILEKEDIFEKMNHQNNKLAK